MKKKSKKTTPLQTNVALSCCIWAVVLHRFGSGLWLKLSENLGIF